MIVVDASVMVSALHPPDVNYHVSRAWLRQYLRTGGELVAPILRSSVFRILRLAIIRPACINALPPTLTLFAVPGDEG